jgi:hypothetical protein
LLARDFFILTTNVMNGAPVSRQGKRRFAMNVEKLLMKFTKFRGLKDSIDKDLETTILWIKMRTK